MANRVKTSDLVSRFYHLAQTSVYQVKLQPPSEVVKYLKDNGFNYNADGLDVELRCKMTKLPSSNFNTHTQKDDFMGVTEVMAYRREVDDIEFDFYVDNRYDVVEMFDGWMEYISGHNNGSFNDPYRGYRMSYPDDYKTNVFISKFEKGFADDRRSYQLDYTLVNAFPISSFPMQVSYDDSDTLLYTVRFNYQRFTRRRGELIIRD